MNIQSLVNWMKGDQKEAPEGYCPNCWGHQGYGDQFREAVKKERITTLNADEKLGWIQGYAATHLEGIHLKPVNNVLTCSECKLTYDPV